MIDIVALSIIQKMYLLHPGVPTTLQHTVT